MSLKKATALSFLLLAGIIILVHAVITHHHHDGIPVIVASANHDDSHPDDTNNTEIVYVRLGNEKQTLQSPDFDCDFYPLSCLFSDYATYQIKNDVGSLYLQPPYIQLLHTAFIARSIGLRAPPVC